EAQSLMNAGKVDAAVEMLTSLAASGTKDTRIDFLLGLAYYQKGDYTRAIASLTACASAASQDSQEYRQSVQLRGLSQYYLGHVREAIPDLERVASWSPENSEIAYALGIAYIQTLDADKARVTFARVFGVAPDSASAHLLAAEMMMHQQAEG